MFVCRQRYRIGKQEAYILPKDFQQSSCEVAPAQLTYSLKYRLTNGVSWWGFLTKITNVFLFSFVFFSRNRSQFQMLHFRIVFRNFFMYLVSQECIEMNEAR
jgi:hypothetical protein